MTSQYLKCDFTEQEINAKARELAAANRRRQDIEQSKKEIDKDLAAKIEEQTSKIQRLSNDIDKGFEFRDVEVETKLDTPDNGLKTIIRLDTGEEVGVEKMTDEDKQLVLGIDDTVVQ